MTSLVRLMCALEACVADTTALITLPCTEEVHITLYIVKYKSVLEYDRMAIKLPRYPADL